MPSSPHVELLAPGVSLAGAAVDGRIGSVEEQIASGLMSYRLMVINYVKTKLAEEADVTSFRLLELLNEASALFLGRFNGIVGPAAATAYIRAYQAADAGDVPMATIYALADQHTKRIASYYDETSREGLLMGFNTFVNRQVPTRVAADRAMDAYGLTPRQMSGYTSLDLKTGKIASARPITMKRRALEYIGTSIRRRVKIFSTQEAHNLDLQAKQTAWLWLQDKGALSERAQKMWLTAKDEKTCTTCGPMHGKKIGIGDRFELPNGVKVWVPGPHPNCRCEIRILDLGKISKADGDKWYNDELARTPDGRFAEQRSPGVYQASPEQMEALQAYARETRLPSAPGLVSAEEAARQRQVAELINVSRRATAEALEHAKQAYGYMDQIPDNERAMLVQIVDNHRANLRDAGVPETEVDRQIFAIGERHRNYRRPAPLKPRPELSRRPVERVEEAPPALKPRGRSTEPEGVSALVPRGRAEPLKPRGRVQAAAGAEREPIQLERLHESVGPALQPRKGRAPARDRLASLLPQEKKDVAPARDRLEALLPKTAPEELKQAKWKKREMVVPLDVSGKHAYAILDEYDDEDYEFELNDETFEFGLEDALKSASKRRNARMERAIMHNTDAYTGHATFDWVDHKAPTGIVVYEARLNPDQFRQVIRTLARLSTRDGRDDEHLEDPIEVPLYLKEDAVRDYQTMGEDYTNYRKAIPIGTQSMTAREIGEQFGLTPESFQVKLLAVSQVHDPKGGRGYHGAFSAYKGDYSITGKYVEELTASDYAKTGDIPVDITEIVPFDPAVEDVRDYGD